MDEDPSQSSQPAEPERSDAVARAGDLSAHAKAAKDATFDDDQDPTARRIVPGVLTGDVGPKGRVSAQLRDLSRKEGARYGEVPRGTMVPGGGRYILGYMLALVLVLLALAALIAWLSTR